MERAIGPSRIATSAGFLLAALAVLWSLYVLVMPPYFADITGSSSAGTRGLSWLIGTAYALPSILCAAAGAIGAVVIGRGRALAGGVLVALGWACFVAVVAMFVSPSWLA